MTRLALLFLPLSFLGFLAPTLAQPPASAHRPLPEIPENYHHGTPIQLGDVEIIGQEIKREKWWGCWAPYEIIQDRVTAPQPSPSSWALGLRGGFGRSGFASGDTYFPFSGGLMAGRYFAHPGLGLHLEALWEARRLPASVSVSGSSQLVYNEVASPFLFVPLYVRTGAPSHWVHLLLGAGPVVPLAEVPVAGYYPWRVSAAGVVGFDMKVNAYEARHEVLVGFQVRVPLTPAYEYDTGGYNPYGTPFGPRKQDYFWWAGLSVGWVWHSGGGQ